MPTCDELVRKHRLVTLVGVGGTGKTRLMLALAAELVDRYADGVWLVELAGITDALLVVGQIARSVWVSRMSRAVQRSTR